MRVSLIICTYHRPDALLNLLKTVEKQKPYPDQILVVDGSGDDHTVTMLRQHTFKALEYFKVREEDRGLTRQRNFGIKHLAEGIELVFFLDDDILLMPRYFEHIISTYAKYPDAVGVSGYIINENIWKGPAEEKEPLKREFTYVGWTRKEGSRFELRRKFGLAPNAPPGIMPDFSHGYSTGFLPPSGEIYEVEMLMGGIASYRKELFESFRFSPYFEGYGLYEDADFSLRVSKRGKLYVNTNAQVEHHHDPDGRPNYFKYGKMVVRNGWYVWRVKYPSPGFRATAKWHMTSFLLTLVRMGNVITGHQKKEALQESLGRVTGWWSLLFNKPKHEA